MVAHEQSVAATAPNNPKSYIAETGWPTESTTKADSNSGVGGADGEASVENLQRESYLMHRKCHTTDLPVFLDSFVCQANANGTEYFL
jgi:glucan 1,3-beta-glucosidase